MASVFYEARPNESAEVLFTGFVCDHPFPMHVHDVVELVCLKKGNVAMTIGGEKIFLSAGDIAVAFPTVPHSYDEVSDDAEGITLIFVPGVIQEFHPAFRTMVPKSAWIPRRIQHSQVSLLVDQMMLLTDDEMKQLRLGYLHLLIAYLMPAMNLVSVNRHVEMGLSYQVFHYISQHFTEPLSLESVAHALGISRIHLSHIFSQQLHINFRQYINTLRIDRACALLRDPANSISQIAYLCGYGNPRTFHRAFLSQCNMPPKQYRAKLNIHNAADDAEDVE